MDNTRRSFIKSAVGAGAIAALAGPLSGADRSAVTAAALDRAAAAPVLKTDGISVRVKIASVELLRGAGQYFVRVRSTDGAEGVAITNSRAAVLYPIFQQLVAPYFVGKDARGLDKLVDGVYVYRSNYKLSGLSLWCCVAWIEFAILDMLQFASCAPNLGAFQEYKGGMERTGQWYDPPLKLKDGAVTVPTGPGMGLSSDAKMFKNAKLVGQA